MIQRFSLAPKTLERYPNPTVLPLLLFFILFSPAPAQAAEPKRPTTRFSSVQFPFAGMQTVEAATLRPEDVPGVFPAFQHEPFDTAGFNPLSLPFRFTAAAHGRNPHEANAVP